MMLRILVVAVFFAAAAAAENVILEPGAELETLSEEFSFTEGPIADAEGNVYFTDQPNDRIMKWSLNGEITTWMQPSGRSNGMYFDADGMLWSCADEKNQLWKIAPDKTVTVVVDGRHEGKRLNGPNDVWVRPDGGAYFTDPFYKRPWWDHEEQEQPVRGVYYVPPGGNELVLVDGEMQQPNGIIGTPDGKTLYVSDISGRETYSYTINDDGTLSDKTLFCEMGSDGMTIDNRGNVYLTNNGVFVFDKSGEQIEHIEAPGNWTANVCFGGEDRKWLFITATKGLYRIRTQVNGVCNYQAEGE